MKIGTDAVLLGSWVDIRYSKRILDIGTGCGIIALMLAQRSEAEIDAVEIDPDSAEEAHENFQISSWKNQLNLFEADIREFAKSNQKRYDLIVSNPPFFSNSLRSPDPSKNISKHDLHLNIRDLFRISHQMLIPGGKLSLIIPSDLNNPVTEIARKHNLYVNRQLNIIPTQVKPINRILVEFSSSNAKNIRETNLILRHSDSSFTEEYKNLTSDFYIHF